MTLFGRQGRYSLSRLDNIFKAQGMPDVRSVLTVCLSYGFGLVLCDDLLTLSLTVIASMSVFNCLSIEILLTRSLSTVELVTSQLPLIICCFLCTQSGVALS